MSSLIRVTLWGILNTIPPLYCSEKLFMDMADRMAEDGFRDVGYEYISIDVSCCKVGS